jgi:CubicO group peptidase (beta-lactamase class C family)
MLLAAQAPPDTVLAVESLPPLPEPPATLPGRLEVFRHTLDTLCKKHRIPGLAVAVLRRGEVLMMEGIGWANIDSQGPVTPDTPFEIASLTKVMASTVVLQLVEEGTLHLDSTLHPYWEGYREYCQNAATSRNGYLRNYRCCDTCGNTLRYHLSHTALGTKPGQWFLYNGILYGLLRHVIEQQTEMPLVDTYWQRLYWQAGMTSTLVCGQDSTRAPHVLPNLAQNYKWDVRKRKLMPMGNGLGNPSTSAGMISTLRDLARFDQALDAGRLLHRRTLEQEAWATRRDSAGKALIYGLGWFLQPNHAAPSSPRLAWHYGWLLNGWSCLYLKAPDEGYTLVLLANSEGLAEGFNLALGDVRRSPFARTFLRLFVERPI